MTNFPNVHSAERETNHSGTVDIFRLISNGAVDAKLATYNYAWLQPEGEVEEHVHDDCIEYFLILAGVGNVYLDGEPSQVKAGDFIQIDAEVRHSLENTGEELLEFITLRAILEDI